VNPNLPSNPNRRPRLSGDPYTRAAEVAALFPSTRSDVLLCESCRRPGPLLGAVVIGGSCFVACARCAPTGGAA